MWGSLRGRNIYWWGFEMEFYTVIRVVVRGVSFLDCGGCFYGWVELFFWAIVCWMLYFKLFCVDCG